MAQRKKQLIAEGKLDKHGRPNADTPKEYLRALPDVGPAPAAADGDAAAANGQAEAVGACLIMQLALVGSECRVLDPAILVKVQSTQPEVAFGSLGAKLWALSETRPAYPRGAALEALTGRAGPCL